jgi:L-amino acid N-acyltransferase YncA
MDQFSEVIIKNYPQAVTLEDGTRVILRPLLKEDEPKLVEYFQSLTPQDRLCLQHDFADPKVVEDWIYELDYGEVFPLVALDDGRIVGHATLIFSPIGWTRHQGEVHLTTAPQLRAKGLGTLLLQNLIDLAQLIGLEQLTGEIPPMLDKAFILFGKLGFQEVEVLKGFAMDQEGRESDIVLMLKPLQKTAS